MADLAERPLTPIKTAIPLPLDRRRNITGRAHLPRRASAFLVRSVAAAAAGSSGQGCLG